MKKSHCVAALAMLGLSAVCVFAGQADAQNQKADLAEAVRLSQQVVSLYKQQKYDEALPAAKRAVELREKHLGAEHQLTGMALKNLANVYMAKRDFGEAARIYQRALAAYEKAFGENDPKVADMLDELGWAAYAVGANAKESAKAEDFFQRALAIREKTFGPETQQAGESHYELGLFYQRLGHSGKSIDSFRRAIKIKEKTEGANGKGLTDVLEKCACSLMLKGERGEAADMYSRARMIKGLGGAKSIHPSSLQVHALTRAPASYPQEAIRQRIDGTVVVEVTVDETGKVINARSVCGSDLLAGAAIEAAHHWVFSPTKEDGHPIKVTSTINFNFTLPR